jgi:hypothetical protein
MNIGDGTTGSRFKWKDSHVPDEEGATSSLRRRRSTEGARSGERMDDGIRKLVAGGTPTGGRMYPFLALVQYTNESSEEGNPFRPVRTQQYLAHTAEWFFLCPTSHFSQVPYCHGVMLASDVLLRPAWCDVYGTSGRVAAVFAAVVLRDLTIEYVLIW